MKCVCVRTHMPSIRMPVCGSLFRGRSFHHVACLEDRFTLSSSYGLRGRDRLQPPGSVRRVACAGDPVKPRDAPVSMSLFHQMFVSGCSP